MFVKELIGLKFPELEKLMKNMAGFNNIDKHYKILITESFPDGLTGEHIFSCILLFDDIQTKYDIKICLDDLGIKGE